MTHSLPEFRSRLGAEATEIIGRYPKPRSALMPLLHLVQAEQGYVTEEGITFCAERLGLEEADVAAVTSVFPLVQGQAGRGYHHRGFPHSHFAPVGRGGILA